MIFSSHSVVGLIQLGEVCIRWIFFGTAAVGPCIHFHRLVCFFFFLSKKSMVGEIWTYILTSTKKKNTRQSRLDVEYRMVSDGRSLLFGDVNNKKRNLHAWNVHEVSLYLNKISYPTAPVIPCEVRCLGTQNPLQKYNCRRDWSREQKGWYIHQKYEEILHSLKLT